MTYPSLLFKNEYTDRKVESDVAVDMKIDLLVPKSVLPMFERPCGKEDILLRQELFRAMESNRLREQFSKLAVSVAKLSRISEAFFSASCNNERNAVYISLICALSDFSKLACEDMEYTGSYFCKRFSEFFANEYAREENFSIYEEAASLREKLEKISKVCYSVEKDMLNISKPADGSISEKIKSAAAKMGIELIGGGEYLSEPINPDLIDEIAKLSPDEFSAFSDFYNKYGTYFNKDILGYKQELDFCLSMVEVTDIIRNASIPLVYPEICEEKQLVAREVYDVTLLCKNCKNIIPNDVDFSMDEPFFFLTGANGGGKTTYLRAVGTAVLFFMMGCPIAARSACMSVPDNFFTHFPKDERFDTQGRFEDEKLRVDKILSEVTSSSFVLLNETYSTTNEETARRLTAELAKKLYDKNVFGIYVTHQQSLEENSIPCLNVIIDKEDENRRTYKISKRAENKGSYAKDVLKKYGLTEEALAKRFAD
ncbi:MAG: hypothetical protein E7623_05385 [Ruminococcaceae bacterium]|nr:hypothetical protein [Oscillospiraceae bacterium]